MLDLLFPPPFNVGLEIVHFHRKTITKQQWKKDGQVLKQCDPGQVSLIVFPIIGMIGKYFEDSLKTEWIRIRGNHFQRQIRTICRRKKFLFVMFVKLTQACSCGSCDNFPISKGRYNWTYFYLLRPFGFFCYQGVVMDLQGSFISDKYKIIKNNVMGSCYIHQIVLCLSMWSPLHLSRFCICSTGGRNW